jgi:starvation-inducible DNA-binding protein
MYATHHDLSISTRESVVTVLSAHLINAADLFMQVKHAQWNVKGPNVTALQTVFRSMARVITRHCDAMANRIVALGGQAEATARLVAARSSIDEFPRDTPAGLAYVSVIAGNLSRFGKAIRASIVETTNYGDAVTAELLTRITSVNDQQLQLLDAHLQVEN